MTLADRVETVLTDGGIGDMPASAHAALGMYSRVSVRNALRELVREGRAMCRGPDGHRRYWLSTPRLK